MSGSSDFARTIIKSTFLSIVYSAPEGLVVKDPGNGEIEVRLAGSPDQALLHYVEIEPYVFERAACTPPISDATGDSMAYLQFIINDFGEVQIVRQGALGII